MTQHLPYWGSDVQQWLENHFEQAEADPHGYDRRMTIGALLDDYQLRAINHWTLTERLILDGDDD